MLRSGARPGDEIWVSGHLGDARLALEALLGKIELPQTLLEQTRKRLEAPTPRVALGLALRGVASSALDVSDGLLGDLTHILELSQVGATVDSRLAQPLMAASAYPADSTWTLSTELLQQCTLAGGDDYELCFTAPAARHAEVLAAAAASATPVTCIGHIESEPGLRVLGADGMPQPMHWKSFDHFGNV